MPVINSKFSQFSDGGDLVDGDVVVGLRSGVNTRFLYNSGLGIFLPLAGGTMSGVINMGDNLISSVTDPVEAQDAATKAYVDSTAGAYLPLAGGTMTGDATFATGKGIKSDTTIGNTLLLQGYNTNTAAYVAMGTITAGNPPTFDLYTTTTIGSAYIYRVGGNDVAVTDGGTGASTLTNHGILLGQGTSAVTALTLTNNQIAIGNTGSDPTASSLTGLMDTVFGNAQGDLLYRNASGWVVLAPGTSGQFLQTLGAAANPAWVTSATVTPAALTKVDDTNVTLTLGGTPSTALLQASSITVGWTGTLAETRGGTGSSTYTMGDTLYSSAANTLSKLAGNTTAVKQYLSQTGTGAVSAAPAWATISGGDITGSALSKTDDTNVTMTLGGTPTTALLRAASMTLGWTGQLAVGRGGTGLSAITAHYLPIGNGTSALTLLAPSATSGIPLVSQGAASDPAYSTAVVAGGGTGNTTFTAYSVICAGTTATGAFQNVSGVGTAGQVLQSNGAAALPTWATIPGATSAAMTKVDDTNVTLTLGGAPTTALLTATLLTLGWTGQLGLTRGGTAASLTASNGGIVYSNATTLAILAGTATAGQMLQSGSSTAPTWSTTTWPSTVSTGQLLYTSSSNTVAGLSTTARSVLGSSSAGVPNWLALTDGQIVIGSTAGAPAAASLTAGTGISITPSSNGISIATTGAVVTPAALTKTDDTNVTLTLGGTPSTAVLQATSLTLGWTGQLGLTRGGTAASLTAANGGVVYSTASAMAITAAGTSGQFLQSAGAAAPVWAVASGRLIGIQRFVASGTYTPTSGMATAVSFVQGCGGGSGGVAGTIAQGSASGAGGGGSFLAVSFTAAQIGASQTITLGTAGTAGSSGNNDGGAGGATTIGALTSTPGGLGGKGAASSASNQAVLGGAGGAISTVTTGTLLYTLPGGNGSPGQSFVTIGVNAPGGLSHLGGLTGTTKILGTSDGGGVAGSQYGGGASGAITSNGTSYAGAAGGAAFIVIYEFS